MARAWRKNSREMVTIAWNTTGFHVLAALAKGVKFNATDYIPEILQRILE
jgi:hypothetical protein